MNPGIQTPAVLLLMSCLAGCGHDFTQDLQTPPIALGSETVAATVNGDGYLSATVEATYTNRTGAPTFLWHNSGTEEVRYVFEKHLDGEWVPGWSGVSIGGFPMEVAPGDSMTGILYIHDDTTLPAGDRNFLLLPEPGEYRAVFQVTTDRNGEHPVPAASQVSAPFQLTVE